MADEKRKPTKPTADVWGDAIAKMTEVHEALSKMTEFHDAISKMLEGQEAISRMTELEEAISKMTEVHDAISKTAEVQEAISRMTEVQDVFWKMNEVDRAILRMSEVDSAINRLRFEIPTLARVELPLSASASASLLLSDDMLGRIRLGAPDESAVKASKDLRDELTRHGNEIERLTTELHTAIRDKEESEGIREALQTEVQQLSSLLHYAYLRERVGQEARQRLAGSPKFRQWFLDHEECEAFVVAIDVRRSTELMLKARSAEGFARFMTALCAALMNVITESFGVFDKFTGDGVMAFFPLFYSGEDAAYRVVNVATRCHDIFAKLYRQSRSSFDSVLLDVGLGIGVDYGKVRLVRLADGLTVVGKPVVYACRLSGAPAGVTLFNQPAYELLIDRFGSYCHTSESDLIIKHEGRLLAYEVKLNNQTYTPKPPRWPDDEPDVQPPSPSTKEPGGAL